MYITVRLHVPVISRGMAYGGVAETRESRRKCAEVCALEVSGSVFLDSTKSSSGVSKLVFGVYRTSYDSSQPCSYSLTHHFLGPLRDRLETMAARCF